MSVGGLWGWGGTLSGEGVRLRVCELDGGLVGGSGGWLGGVGAGWGEWGPMGLGGVWVFWGGGLRGCGGKEVHFYQINLFCKVSLSEL